MEDYARPLKLNRDLSRVLGQMRSGKTPAVLFGQEPDLCDQALRKITDPMLEGAGLMKVKLDQYRWFVRELSKLFRTKSGFELAFHIELCMRKWLNFGLEINTMQFLICEIDRQLKELAGTPLELSGSEAKHEAQETESS